MNQFGQDIWIFLPARHLAFLGQVFGLRHLGLKDIILLYVWKASPKVVHVHRATWSSYCNRYPTVPVGTKLQLAGVDLLASKTKLDWTVFAMVHSFSMDLVDLRICLVGRVR